MRALIVDPFAGISGDMFLGALLDLGLSEEWLRDLIADLSVADPVVRVEAVNRSGIACTRVAFELPQEHAHRHLADVLEIIDASRAQDEAKSLAAAAFRALAEAEAEVHGVAVEHVHFHEVGALDAILDILCSMAGVRELGVEEAYTRPIALGSGWIHIAHGRFPVPAPATLKLLEGMPASETTFEGECTTPTGAAIVKALTGGRTPQGSFSIVASGYGAGTRDPEDRPNCLRLILAELEGAAYERLILVQADVDDMAPEHVPAAQEALLEAGALDAVVSGVGMKKGRPGLRFEALVAPAELDGVVEALFLHTTTIGARFWPVQRPSLSRSESLVEWRGHEIRSKVVRLPDGRERSKPEYEDVVRAARATGVSAIDVLKEIEGPGSGREDRAP